MRLWEEISSVLSRLRLWNCRLIYTDYVPTLFFSSLLSLTHRTQIQFPIWSDFPVLSRTVWRISRYLDLICPGEFFVQHNYLHLLMAWYLALESAFGCLEYENNKSWSCSQQRTGSNPDCIKFRASCFSDAYP